jgi:hypothetical protein
VKHVADSADAAATAAEGSAHGASGERLLSEANEAVVAAPELHEANLVGQLDSWQDNVSAGKAKKIRHKKKRKKKACEQQQLAILAVRRRTRASGDFADGWRHRRWLREW